MVRRCKIKRDFKMKKINVYEVRDERTNGDTFSNLFFDKEVIK